MRILIAPDKFKGSLTSAEAAAAIETGFRRVFPDLFATRIPLADGGEGTAALFREALDGQRIEATVADPLGVPVAAEFTWLPQTRDAVIEMSAASGLWRLADSERNPLRNSTRGTGELVRAAIAQGPAASYSAWAAAPPTTRARASPPPSATASWIQPAKRSNPSRRTSSRSNESFRRTPYPPPRSSPSPTSRIPSSARAARPASTVPKKARPTSTTSKLASLIWRA